jgi:hypothetical protein
VCCKPDATVRIIYDTIITAVDLIEHHLFALAILLGAFSQTELIHHCCSHIDIDDSDDEYCFPSMDLKVSKLASDSKWKTGQSKFVMQLKSNTSLRILPS